MTHIVVNSKSYNNLIDVLRFLCNETGYFCYRPLDNIEPIISAVWAETLQYVPDGCFSDETCASKILDMFGLILQKALNESYIFVIDTERVKGALTELLKLQSTLQQGIASITASLR